MSVGLLVVRLLYCFYVCVHLSIWFTFFCPLFSVGSLSFTLAHNVLGLRIRAGFEAQRFNLLLKFIRSAKLQVCTSARLTQNPC